MAANSVPWTHLFERIGRGCISSRRKVRGRGIQVKRPSKRPPNVNSCLRQNQVACITERLCVLAKSPSCVVEFARVTSEHEVRDSY